MKLIAVDTQLCVKCGRCAAVCPRGLIRFDSAWPESANEELCIACGQCVAICPTTALDNEKAPLAEQIPYDAKNLPDSDTATQFLRSRRSVRCYKKQPVDREKLLQLMEIARFAPTGSNSQSISYRVIENPETLRNISEQTVVWLERQAAGGHAAAKSYAQYAFLYRSTGQDVILRSAPCMVMGMALKTFPRGQENTHFSLAYAELYAPTLGLGTFWAGLFTAAAFAGFAPLVDLLGLPVDKCLTGAIMVGYPEFTFHRLVNRNPLDISFDTDN